MACASRGFPDPRFGVNHDLIVILFLIDSDVNYSQLSTDGGTMVAPKGPRDTQIDEIIYKLVQIEKDLREIFSAAQHQNESDLRLAHSFVRQATEALRNKKRGD
jgi:hypothetical protein